MVGMLSDIGNNRKKNEDYIGAYEDNKKRAYVVADGIGGHNAGEIASKLAVEKILESIKRYDEIDDLKQCLIEAVQYANTEIFHLACQNNEYRGMGTTITTCLVVKNKMVVANVGDSRCYVVKGNEMLRITKDHSLVQQLLDSGEISKEEAAIHPNRNVITRALGTKFSVKVDIFELSLCKGQKVILCTDGLTKELNENEIYSIIKQYKNNQVICEQMVKESKEKGAKDNISVVLFEGEGNE
ncbi:Stp1/IreP family PP2C-type Ser/Thr phosphatase [Haloimpatiens sp. FM7330]|uniref:Stp1/IreP family PP2C-type Ser/Thr phosphatase n=1 Tax=Haloimpatiens sp. FM7330 TaxID=3298610 RepID=UPI0036378C96